VLGARPPGRYCLHTVTPSVGSGSGSTRLAAEELIVKRGIRLVHLQELMRECFNRRSSFPRFATGLGMSSRPVSGCFVIAAAAIASPHPLGGERALPSSADTYGAERPCRVPLLASVAAIDGPSSATENATLCNFLCPAGHGRQSGKRRKCRAIEPNARFTRGFYLASAAEQARYLVIALRKPDRGSLGRPPETRPRRMAAVIGAWLVTRPALGAAGRRSAHGRRAVTARVAARLDRFRCSRIYTGLPADDACSTR
jgi:hypothetical protein